MRKRRIILAAVVLALVVGITVVVWEAADWPPPRLILTYGFPPAGGPTGRTKVIEGIEFVELRAGYVWARCRIRLGGATLADVLQGRDEFPSLLEGTQPYEDSFDVWADVPTDYWISRASSIELVARVVERWKKMPQSDRPKAERIESYPEWLSMHLPGRLRPPTDEELRFAAAQRIFPGRTQLVRAPRGKLEETECVLLGSDWQGFDEPFMEYFRRGREESGEVRIVGGHGFGELWTDPPLVWIPPEDE